MKTSLTNRGHENTCMAFHKIVIIFLLISMVCLSTQSCTPLYSSLNTLYLSNEKDVTNLPEYQDLISHTYETIVDLFLFQHSDESSTGTISVGEPGRTSDLPYSVQEYINDPENWEYTDTWSKDPVGPFTTRSKVLGILPRGTQFTINKVVKDIACDGFSYRKIYIKVIGIEKLKNKTVRLSLIFSNPDNLPPAPKPNLVRVID